MIRVTRKLFQILDQKQKRFVGLLIILMLLGGILESMSISMIYPLISAVMDDAGWDQAWYARLLCGLFHITAQRDYVLFLLIGLIILFIVKNLYLVLEYRIQYRFIGNCRYRMQAGLMHSYIRKPYTFFLSANYGEIVRIVNADVTAAFNLLTGVLIFYTEVIVSFILGVTIIVMSPRMAVAIIAILLLELLIIACIIKPVMRRMGEGQRDEEAISNQWLLESLNGIKSIKVAARENYFESNFIRHTRNNVRLTAGFQTLYNLPRLLIEAFTIVGVLCIMLIFILLGADLTLLVPQLSVFMVAAVRLLPSVNRISTNTNQVPFYEGGLDNVIAVLKSGIDLNDDWELSEHKKGSTSADTDRKEIKEGIRFCEVSFKYPGNDHWILDHADLTIPAGYSVGIIGSSGAGKTTAMDVMLGLLIPQEGRVLVDGRDIQADMAGWLSNVAYIPQSIFLTDDSIRSNVAFGVDNEDISDERVMQCLKEAQLAEFIMGLPEGISTRVGEQGIRLSGGQRQRIGIARALYHDPQVLFFDEATSALDNETEAAIMESIDHLKGMKTMIIIAHRLSTIENCDAIYKVEHGRIEKCEAL